MHKLNIFSKFYAVSHVVGKGLQGVPGCPFKISRESIHLMLPRQPIMPKRRAYYASENMKNEWKHGKGHKSTPDGSFELSDQGKMPLELFLGKINFE